MKRLKRGLVILMGLAAVSYAAYALYVLWDHRTHPEMYMAWSAPWYTGLLVYGILTAAFLAVCFAAGMLIRYFVKRKEKAGMIPAGERRSGK